MPDRIISPSTAKMLGVPDVTNGEPIIATNAAEVHPGDTLNINNGTLPLPKFVPDHLLGQQPPPAPQLPPPVATVPADQPIFTGPQTITTQDTQTQFTPGKKLDLADMATIAKSEAEQASAQASAIKEEAARDRHVAEIEQQRAFELARAEERRKQIAEENRLTAASKLQEWQDAQTEQDKLAPPSESVGTRTANVIALLLGGFGEALGGKNNVAQTIENNRAQKLNVWRAQYQRLSGKVQGAANIYANFRSKGMDDEAASAATVQHLNAGYDDLIRSIMAKSKAPITEQLGSAALSATARSNALAHQALEQAAQGSSTTMQTTRSVTKDGGADIEGRGKLLEQANKNKEIEAYRETRNNLGRFTDLTKGGADGAALADFIANTMKQGSYTPSTFNEALKKRGIFDKSYEQLRAYFSGGVPPDLMRELGNSLAIATRRTKAQAQPAIDYFGTQFRQAGIPKSVLLGNESADEAAAAVGATPR